MWPKLQCHLLRASRPHRSSRRSDVSAALAIVSAGGDSTCSPLRALLGAGKANAPCNVGSKDLIHRVGGLDQRVLEIFALRHELWKVATRNDEAALLRRRQADCVLRSFPLQLALGTRARYRTARTEMSPAPLFAERGRIMMSTS